MRTEAQSYNGVAAVSAPLMGGSQQDVPENILLMHRADFGRPCESTRRGTTQVTPSSPNLVSFEICATASTVGPEADNSLV